MMNTQPVISVVICTRNRAAFLQPFFSALDKISTTISWELIVVNNASTDNTAELLAEYANRASVPVRVVYESLPGLGRARNAGWRQAQGEIVAFTDDDCYPEPNFIDKVLAEFADNNIGFVGGRVELFDPQDLPITIKVDKTPQFYPAYSFIGPGGLHGANFSFRKDILIAMDGFDPCMGSGTPFPSEDCDAVYRALQVGKAGKYSPDIVVYHHHRRRTEADRIKIESSYLAGRGAFYTKILVSYPRKAKTFIQWMKSAKCFGWHFLPKEVWIGIQYLLFAAKNKNV
ncbi:glycosyltransferase [Methylobacillus pratensis]